MREDTGERFFESIFYGIPSYAFSGTPDGRIVGELSKGRREEEERHRAMMQVQRDLATGLQTLHGGRGLVPRDEFRDSGAVNLLATATRQMGTLNGQVDALLGETHLLAEITKSGLTDLSGRVAEVRSAVAGVGQDIRFSTAEASRTGRAAQGPRPRMENIRTLVQTSRRMLEVLGAHQKGILNEDGRQGVEELVDLKLSSREARDHLVRTINTNIKEGALKAEAMKLLEVVEEPSLLLRRASRDRSVRQVALMREINGKYPNPHLARFVEAALMTLRIGEESKNMPIGQDLLVDLVNNHLVVEPIAFEVKKHSRDARMDGSAVDRNFNLHEGLGQGDRLVSQGASAQRQREGMLSELRTQTLLSGAAVVGQAAQSRQAGQQRAQMLSGLQTVVEVLVDNGERLVDLNRLAANLTRTVDEGFSDVSGVLSSGFAMERQALADIAQEVATSRAAILAQLSQIDGTIQRVGGAIQTEIQRGNAQLERLVKLTEGSLENVARQRFRQGARFLQIAERPEDYKEALRVFEEGIREDPTFAWNQYGAGAAAEALGEEEGALTRYRHAARMSDSSDLSAAAWTKYSTVKVKQGELPEAIEHLKKALEKDRSNGEAKFMLAKSLALTGQQEEALASAVELIETDKVWIYKMSLDPAFSAIFHALLRRVWNRREKMGLDMKLAKFFFDKFVEKQDEEGFTAVLQYAFEYGPETLLKQKWLSDALPPALKAKVAAHVIEIVEKKPGFYSAEAWYAVAFMGLRLRMEERLVQVAFEQGGKTDMDYLRGNYRQVRANLQKIDPERAAELAQKANLKY